MKKFTDRFPVRIVVFLLLLAVLGCSPAYAESNLGTGALSTSEKALLYTRYQQILDQANDEYGYSLSLVPLEEMSAFRTLTEFQELVNEVCQYKTTERIVSELSFETPSSRSEGTNGNGPWTGDVTYSCRNYHVGNTISATITFKESFIVRLRSEGVYYIYDSMFHPVEVRTSSDLIYYAYDGAMSVTPQDSGRSTRISQAFIVYYDHDILDHVSFGATFYFNRSTGGITAASM